MLELLDVACSPPLTRGSHRRAQGMELMLPQQIPPVVSKRPYSEYLQVYINLIHHVHHAQ